VGVHPNEEDLNASRIAKGDLNERKSQGFGETNADIFVDQKILF
jgi:hypothetical protein